MTQNRYTPQALEPNAVYHIFSHAVGNGDLFRDTANYAYFLKKWSHFSKDYFRTYAFCLMPNHFHLCVQTLEVGIDKLMEDMPLLVQTKLAASSELAAGSAKYHSKRMNSFLSSYAQAFNKYHARKGALFRSKFGRLKVTDADYFKDLICYIHHNPIHHFGADDYDAWVHSSYKAYRTENDYAFLDTAVATNRFGTKAAFLAHHEAYRTRKHCTDVENNIEAYYRLYD